MKWTIALFFLAVIYLHSSEAQINTSNTLKRKPDTSKNTNSAVTPSQEQWKASIRPMYFVPGSSKLVEYNTNKKLVLSHGNEMDMYCEFGFIYPKKTLRGTFNMATQSFEIPARSFKVSEIGCEKKFTTVAKKIEKCGKDNKYDLVSIGVEVESKGLKDFYKICYNFAEMSAIYAVHTIQPHIRSKAETEPRTSTFVELYTFGRHNFNDFYGNNPGFDRGHLAPYKDFIYTAEQYASSIYLNSAPQCKNFNQNNWKNLENLVRSNIHDKTLECYTGVIGIKTLGGKPYYFDSKNAKIPVPELFFKFLYEPTTKKGIVFIGVNSDSDRDNYTPICKTTDFGQIKGLTFKDIKHERNQFYVCKYSEFIKVYHHLPRLYVTDNEILFEHIRIDMGGNSQSSLFGQSALPTTSGMKIPKQS